MGPNSDLDVPVVMPDSVSAIAEAVQARRLEQIDRITGVVEWKRFGKFVGNVILAHVVTYFVAGAIAYPLLTKQFYEGPEPVFASFLRTPLQPDSWQHAANWFLPANLLRGLLMGLVLYQFLPIRQEWRFRKRFLVISATYLVFAFWASAVAAPGTIEGMVYLRPEFTAYVHAMVQPEIVGQGVVFGLWVAAAASPIMQ